MNITIDSLLMRRGARLSSAGASSSIIQMRLELSRKIANSFAEFERLRDFLMGHGSWPITEESESLVPLMVSAGIVEFQGGALATTGADARRYLTGGWLEEYVAAATVEAGADEVCCGQKLIWHAGNFMGENEVDVLARFQERLFFCSCKALKFKLEPGDAGTRSRLTAALHEADNLADHFSPTDAVVALAVTTDLYNERHGKVRYEPFHGKAVALGVNILASEQLPWPVLVDRIRGFFPRKQSRTY